MRRKIGAIVVGVLAFAGIATVVTSSPASASSCNLTAYGWSFNGNPPISPQTQGTIPVQPGGIHKGDKAACWMVGITEDSDPDGWYRIKAYMQETVDVKCSFFNCAYDWDDQGSTRIQFLPPGWGSWIESTDPNFYNYGASQFLLGDANSADFSPNDGHGVWLSQWFYAPTNGSARDWHFRPVYQAHFKSTPSSSWQWLDTTTTFSGILQW